MTKKDSLPDDPTSISRSRIVFLYDRYDQYLSFKNTYSDVLEIDYFNSAAMVMEALSHGDSVDVVIASTDNGGWELLTAIRSDRVLAKVPVLLVTPSLTDYAIQRARTLGSNDIFDENFADGSIKQRIDFFAKRKLLITQKAASKIKLFQVRTPLWKRTIDIVSIGIGLLLLSPVFLLVAIAIKLDSKGPVFYKSKRVGSGYKIFSLYKFRTMRTNADQLIKDMSALNIYEQKDKPEESVFTLCEDCKAKGMVTCDRLLYYDGREICEKNYVKEKEQKAAFMKFQNDPRITGIGTFLRNTSLDELPQLFNKLEN